MTRQLKWLAAGKQVDVEKMRINPDGKSHASRRYKQWIRSVDCLEKMGNIISGEMERFERWEIEGSTGP